MTSGPEARRAEREADARAREQAVAAEEQHRAETQAAAAAEQRAQAERARELTEAERLCSPASGPKPTSPSTRASASPGWRSNGSAEALVKRGPSAGPPKRM